MNHSMAGIDSSGTKLWALWKTYLWRWLLFGLVAGTLQPTAHGSELLYLALYGLLFGFVCFVVFTPLQNAVNTPRVRWKSWLTVVGTWMGVKFLFVLAMFALGPV